MFTGFANPKNMPPKSKKILITHTSREVFVIRRGDGRQIRGFCPGCRQEVELLTLVEAVSLVPCDTRETIRRIDAGSLHAVETGSGHLLVCQPSLEIFLQGETILQGEMK